MVVSLSNIGKYRTKRDFLRFSCLEIKWGQDTRQLYSYSWIYLTNLSCSQVLMAFRSQDKNDNTQSSKGIGTRQWLLKLEKFFHHADHVNAKSALTGSISPNCVDCCLGSVCVYVCLCLFLFYDFTLACFSWLLFI